MTKIPLVKAKVDFPMEVCIRATEGDILAENTIEAVRELLRAADAFGQDLRAVERKFEVDDMGTSDRGPFFRTLSLPGSQIEEVDPHSPMNGLRTAELVAGAMAITDGKMTHFLMDEIERHSEAHDLANQTYRAVIFPAGVMIHLPRPFWIMESAITHHEKLFHGDIDRAVRVIYQKGASAHAKLHTSSNMSRYLSGLAGSPETAQVRAGLPRGINESLPNCRFIVSG